MFVPVILKILPYPFKKIQDGFVIHAELIARHVQTIAAKWQREWRNINGFVGVFLSQRWVQKQFWMLVPELLRG